MAQANDSLHSVISRYRYNEYGVRCSGMRSAAIEVQNRQPHDCSYDSSEIGSPRQRESKLDDLGALVT